MTLDEWIALSPDERNEIRFGWTWRYGDADTGRARWEKEGLPLVSEAADRFRQENGKHPLINHIAPNVSLFGNSEPAIHVVTALFPPQRIEDLPDRFATFAVQQEPILSNKESYLIYWRLVLGEFLGWTPQQVDDWAAEKWLDGLDGKDGLFYHEPPCYYIELLLVPNDIKPYVRSDEVCDAIGEPMSRTPYGWAAAKERVRLVIERLRAGLKQQ